MDPNAPAYDLTKIASLSDVEKTRLCIALFCHKEGAQAKMIDVDRASQAAGLTNGNSFRTLHNLTLRKLLPGGAEPAAPATPKKSSSAKKAASTKKAASASASASKKKRAISDEEIEVEVEEEDDDPVEDPEPDTPTPKKARKERKPKSCKPTSEKSEDFLLG